MNDQNILTEITQKLKTKVLIFSGVALFIGITKTLPTELSLIGMKFKNEKVLGWFLIAIMAFLLAHFLVMIFLDITKYFKKNIINIKARNFTGDTIGLTYKEIGEEYDKREQYNEFDPDKNRGTLSEEANDIHRKIKILEDSFDSKHLNFYNIIELLFNVFVPIFLAILGMKYLYCFLMQ
jgi:hypothetical protein